MKNLLFFILVIYSFLSKSQTPFSGIIIEQNSNYKAIPNVQVKSGASNTISSDVKGNFNLLFQDKKEGDEIYVQAEKAGYEIVNAKEMATKITKRQTNPFRIVMCKAGLLAQNRAKYYEISEKHITQKYEKELAKFNRSTEGWREKAAKLEENFRSSLEFARELADRYSMMNLDDVSELQRKAFRLYEENKVDEALKILEGENYQENIKQVKAEQKKIQENTQLADNEIAKAEEVIQQQISKLMFQADLYAQDFQFDKAERTYEISVEADTSMFDNISRFANFLYKQNQHDKAISYYKKALALAKTDSQVADSQNYLGILYWAKYEFNLALQSLQIALMIREHLAKIDSATYQSDVANTQHNLGGVFQTKHDLGHALQAYQAALAIRENLTKINSTIYEPDVANTQHNLGGLYLIMNDLGLAQQALQTALSIRERLSKTNPVIYEPMVGNTQNDLGILFKAKNNVEAALESYQKALSIHERLAKTNPAAYEPQVANIQNNLGLLYAAKNDLDTALKIYQIALGINERLAKANPATYEVKVAMTQNNIGLLYTTKNNWEAALTAYQIALSIYERLAKTYSTTYEPFVAIIQNSIGHIYTAKNDLEAALKIYQIALGIYERLSKIYPDKYTIEFGRSIVLLSSLQQEYYHADRQPQVDQYLATAKQMLQKYKDVTLAKELLKAVDQLQTYFATLEVLKPIQILQKQIEDEKDYANKIHLQRQVIEHYQSLLNKGYSNLLFDLGSSLSGLAWFEIFEKQFSEAEKSVKEALNPTKYAKTEDYDTKMEWANTNLALAYLFQGKYAEAAKIYIALKDKSYNNETYRETFLADLDDLEKAGITHPDVAKIRELLNK